MFNIMKSTSLILLISLSKIINAKITIDITSGSGANISDVVINYSGHDVDIITAHEISLFKVDTPHLKDALRIHYGKTPTNVYLKSPTPWGDLYKKYGWEPVKRVLSVKSANVKRVTKKPIIVMSHDFENKFNNSIKVNTGISQSVENTLTTSWTKNQDFTLSQEIEYNVNVLFGKIQGTTGISYTTSWGKSEEKSETVTIGSTSSVETELQPGQAATAVLSANRGYLEIEIIYAAKLRGNLAVNYKKTHNGHHFYGPGIDGVMKKGGISNEVITTETVKVGYYTDASLKVYDKVTRMPL